MYLPVPEEHPVYRALASCTTSSNMRLEHLLEVLTGTTSGYDGAAEYGRSARGAIGSGSGGAIDRGVDGANRL